MSGAVPSRRIERVRDFASRRRWSDLVRELQDLTEAELVAAPELAVHLADGLWRVGQAERSLSTIVSAEGAIRQAGGRERLLDAINIRGIALFELGRVDEAAAAFGELLETAEEWESHEFAARAANNLGVHASLQRRYDAALTHYERALASYSRLGQSRGIAQTHYNLGVNYRELGFHDKAESQYRLAMSHAERSDGADLMGLVESDRGLLRLQMGDPELGRVFAARARDRFRALSDPVREGEALRVVGLCDAAVGDAGDALQRLDDALAIARRHGNLLLHAEVQLARGRLMRDTPDRDAAQSALMDAAEQFESMGAGDAAEETRREAAALRGR